MQSKPPLLQYLGRDILQLIKHHLEKQRRELENYIDSRTTPMQDRKYTMMPSRVTRDKEVPGPEFAKQSDIVLYPY